MNTTATITKMEQQPSHVEAFLLGKTLDDDFLEANVINHHYDILCDEEWMDASPSLLLEMAIGRAHETLTDRTIRGSMEFGYETAVYAWRWLHYRSAYLKDLEPIYKQLDSSDRPNEHGLPKEFGSYAEKLAFYEEQQREAIEQMLRKSPVMYDTFADLEVERMHRQFDPNAYVLDPFELEEEFALRSLCRILDRVASHPEASRIDNTAKYTVEPDSIHRPNLFEVTRQEFRNGRVDYVLEESEVAHGNHNATEVMPLATYRIDCRPNAIRFYGVECGKDAPADTFHLIDLAQKLHLTAHD